MKWFFEIALSGFWEFVGCWILISIPFYFVFRMWNRWLRHKNILKHGYPPPHCDADGDFREKKTEES